MLNVVLVAPEIPPNTGNVARLCGATGCVLHLVEPLGFQLTDRYLRRAGLDYWSAVDVRIWPSLENLQQHHPDGRFYFFSSRAARPYTLLPAAPGDFLVFGQETNGLPEAILVKHFTQVYTIPMWGSVRSLNLSTSVGIVVYDVLRRLRGF